MLQRLFYRLEMLVRDNRPGWLVVGAMATVFVFGIALMVATISKRRSSTLLFGMLAAEGGLLGAAGLVMELHRRRMVTLGVLPAADADESVRARMLAEALSQTLETQYFATCVSVFVLALTAVALWRERPKGWSRRFILLALALACVPLATILIRQEYWYFGSHFCLDSPDERYCKTHVLWEALLEGGRVFRIGRYALWVLGAVLTMGTTWLAVRDARRGLLASRRAVLGSSALLGLGALATISTRATAYDGTHLVPVLRERGDPFLFTPIDIETIPRGPAGCSTIDGPLVSIDESRVELDGTRVGNPSEFEKMLANKRDLWHQVNPFHKDQYRTLRVVAARVKATKDIWPWIEGARRAGFDEIAVVYKIEPSAVFHTATVGALTRVRFCDATWKGETAPGTTWNDLAAAAVPVRW